MTTAHLQLIKHVLVPQRPYNAFRSVVAVRFGPLLRHGPLDFVLSGLYMNLSALRKRHSEATG
jgi:hypothetical protein